MADDFIKELTDANPGFRPEPFYNEAGDSVDYQIVHEAIATGSLIPAPSGSAPRPSCRRAAHKVSAGGAGHSPKTPLKHAAFSRQYYGT
ncbi:MAG: hypothetical protein HQ592_14385 [Planctomycetes bacterium]|nr:hypothetical protein [Planctomycetota bacterium]